MPKFIALWYRSRPLIDQILCPFGRYAFRRTKKTGTQEAPLFWKSLLEMVFLDYTILDCLTTEGSYGNSESNFWLQITHFLHKFIFEDY